MLFRGRRRRSSCISKYEVSTWIVAGPQRESVLTEKIIYQKRPKCRYSYNKPAACRPSRILLSLSLAVSRRRAIAAPASSSTTDASVLPAAADPCTTISPSESRTPPSPNAFWRLDTNACSRAASAAVRGAAGCCGLRMPCSQRFTR